MAQFSVDTFTTALKQGGALASLFQCELTDQKGTAGQVDDFKFLCKGVSFPASTIEAASVTFMGRALNIPGNRAAAQVTTSVYNDENMEIRNNIESWMERINSHATNKRDSGMMSILGNNSYTGTLTVKQFSKTGDDVSPPKSYEFVDCWPSACGEIALSWDANEIQTFDITWEFNYWKSAGSGAGGGPGGGPPSDFRLKDDIFLIRKATSTMPNLYMFKYKWDKVSNYIGVMAQELLDTGFKNAAIKGSDGFYSVDYRQLGFPMLKIN